MLSFLVISFTLIIVKAQSSWCIWGKEGVNSAINGKYDYDSDYNGKPSYIKTIGAACAASTLYLWSLSTGTAWRIYTNRGADTDSFLVQCSQSDLSLCTTGNWGTGNAAVYAQSGSCPEWNCQLVNTTQTANSCDGPFTQDIGTNIWANSNNNRYWYFVPHMFSWVCNNANQVNTCPTYHFSITQSGWTDLSGGQSINVQFTTANINITANFDINCIGSGTPSPTLSTSSPTTSTPTTTPITAAPTAPTTITPAPTKGGPSVCIWGRTDAINDPPLNVGINGLYDYDGDTANGKPSYKKTAHASCGLSTVYLYTNTAGTVWRIGTTKGSDSYIAGCAQSDLSLCTKGQWTAVQKQGEGFTPEPNLYYQPNSCPFWNCASISSTGGSSNCRSFTDQMGENTWNNTAGYVWIFNPSFFSWFCIDSNTYNYKACDASFSSAIEPGWTDLSADSNTDLIYSFPTASPTTHTVSCNGIGTTTTNSPSKNPTASPSKNPSVSPSKNPTNNPITTEPTTSPTNNPSVHPTTAIPTLQPSSMPTLQPTEPTLGPTVNTNPTSSPSKIPTKSPSKIPTEIPTTSPNLNPTTSPNSNPTTSPTQNPVNPTQAPTATTTQNINPTGSPSNIPSKSPSNVLPTKSPSYIPTESPTNNDPAKSVTNDPTKSATNIPSNSPTTNENDDGKGLESTNDKGISDTILILIIIVAVIVLCCCLFLFVLCWLNKRNQKKEDELDKKVLKTHDKSQRNYQRNNDDDQDDEDHNENEDDYYDDDDMEMADLRKKKNREKRKKRKKKSKKRGTGNTGHDYMD